MEFAHAANRVLVEQKSRRGKELFTYYVGVIERETVLPNGVTLRIIKRIDEPGIDSTGLPLTDAVKELLRKPGELAVGSVDFDSAINAAFSDETESTES